MSAQIRLILTDAAGGQTEQVYGLPGNLATLDEIEQAVAHFKQHALPQVEKALLTQAQQHFVAQEKKTLLARQRQTPR